MNQKDKDRYIKFENINVLANFLWLYPYDLTHYFSLNALLRSLLKGIILKVLHL